ncbi:MarR family winged helix-turn-helix transcriptional regulator [Cellulomonas sp. P24]|uniref:MarR family winged helix-turn-helix transcriptional regulator n=1 Tax=Cellulomonas sp. P24 TaxID=2885206 RepID=UPI00216B2523|nr:MarR family transcriptional regulator [Cellulomonas sp. P24]MCR6493668.1 MarR family transcriptional regulator [Cellulomonas sp. P24]
MDDDAPPRWLTDEQTRAWIALVSTTVWLPAALDAQLQRDAGVSFVEYTVLSWLSMRPGRASRMSEIAALANVRLSHLSRIAARLEGRGWMRREPDPDDGRATLAILTDAGWDKVVATAPGHVAEVRRLVFDGLTPAQVDQLQQIGTRIVHAAQPDLCLPEPVQDVPG